MFRDDVTIRWMEDLDHMSPEEIRGRLKHLKFLFTLILELGDEGIVVLGRDSSIEYANKVAVELIDVPKEELLDMKFPAFLSETDQDVWKNMFRQLNRNQEGPAPKVCTEFRLTTPKGHTRDLEICLSIAKTADGCKTFAYLHDQTTRIEIQNKLRKANTFLRNLIRSSVDGIMGADTKGNIIIFNEGAEHMLGYKAEDVVGKIAITEIYGSPAEAKAIMKRLRSNEFGGVGKLTTTKVHLKDKQGESIPCDLSAALVYEEGAEAASVGIFTDLRERIAMERELEETHLQLVQSEKMASLGKLAAGVAHEINNPLGGILMYAHILKEDLAPDDPNLQDLEQIIEQTLRCKEIVQNLLDFSRQSGNQRIRFNLNENIHKVMSLFKQQSMFHNIRIVMDMDSELPYVDGDTGLINQAITNLVVNAADAMDGEGTLTLRTYSEKEHGRIVAEIKDTGYGISQEHISKVFDPFFTTKKVGKGTGLGLSTTYGIIQQHGGQLSVTSVPGKGSTFRIELPIPEDDDMLDQ